MPSDLTSVMEAIARVQESVDDTRTELSAELKKVHSGLNALAGAMVLVAENVLPPPQQKAVRERLKSGGLSARTDVVPIAAKSR